MLQLEADRISLRLIQKLLGADKQARALEAASTLHNMPALEGALKLANHHRWAAVLAGRLAGWVGGWGAGVGRVVLPACSAGATLVACPPPHLHSKARRACMSCLPACLYTPPALHPRTPHPLPAGPPWQPARSLHPHSTCACLAPSHPLPPCRATALAERISAFIEQRLALEAAAVELDEEEQYEQYQGDVALHGQRQVRARSGLVDEAVGGRGWLMDVWGGGGMGEAAGIHAWVGHKTPLAGTFT